MKTKIRLKRGITCVISIEPIYLLVENDPCRVCGDPDPGVHHWESGKSLLHLMIALCAGCHAKVHRTKVVLREFPPLLLVLWREQHPEGHEQTYIDFNVRKPPAQSVPLNFGPARKD